IRFAAQRAIQPWRRHLEPLVVDVLDHEQVRQLMAHPLAVVYPDALGRIDEGPEQSAVGELAVDQLVSQAADGAPDCFDESRFDREHASNSDNETGAEQPSIRGSW